MESDGRLLTGYPYDSAFTYVYGENTKHENFVTPHPAYSENIKWYLVNFDATVQRTNGMKILISV